MHPVLGIAIAYVIGSIPFAYLAGRAFGVDLRKQGSGNLGASNVARVIGAKLGITVYVLDTLKGFVAAFALPRLFGLDQDSTWAIAYGTAAMVGHVRPIFFGFRRGGKGMATAGGMFLGLAWLPTLVALGVWAIVFSLTRFASAGSLTAAIVLPVTLGVMRGFTSPIFLASVVLAAFVYWTHRENIGRLRRGEEQPMLMEQQPPLAGAVRDTPKDGGR
jgi:glycerol-3-phosphate acyltransferase PlsY